MKTDTQHSVSCFIFFLFLFIFSWSDLYSQNNDIDNAIEFFEDKKYVEAKSAFQILWEKNNQNSTVAYYLGQVFFEEKDYDKAINWFEKAIELKTDESKYHSWLGKALSLKAINSNIFKQAFLAKKIRKKFEIAIEFDPNNIDARWGLLDFFLAVPGIMGGSTEKALHQAEEIIKIDSIDGLLAYGKIYQRSKDFEKAEKIYLKGINEYPKRDLFYLNLASIYFEKENFQSAFSILEKLLIQEQESMRACYNIGKMASLSGKNLDRGEECLKIFIQHEPKEDDQYLAWAHYRLGLILEKKGSIDLARLEYQKAIELDSNNKHAKKALKKLK